MFKKTEAMNPEIVKPASPLGTGPAMLMRALGLDPAELMNKAGEFEVFAKAAITELVERSKAIDMALAEVREDGKRRDETVLNLSSALTDILTMMTAIQSSCQALLAISGNPILDDALITRRKTQRMINGVSKEGVKHGG